MTDKAPVIAIDGPSGSGKGTVAKLVAQRLGFRYLDSGALYRAVALAALEQGIPWEDEESVARLAAALDLNFEGERVLLHGKDVALRIRDEELSAGASEVAAHPKLRQSLLAHQRAFRKAPGLVAEGRDMGSVIFPDAVLKIFLTASIAERAKRRYKQLREKGMHANLGNLLRDLAERDQRDSNRAAAPLVKSTDAIVIDTTGSSIAEVVAMIMEHYAAR
ncbi:MAG TPA: (d)CMP kinase [Burkholderiales bacterium]|nr:(d)CMP kinase [Burkholderiales bacterium]